LTSTVKLFNQLDQDEIAHMLTHAWAHVEKLHGDLGEVETSIVRLSVLVRDLLEDLQSKRLGLCAPCVGTMPSVRLVGFVGAGLCSALTLGLLTLVMCTPKYITQMLLNQYYV
jgi:hypothetical protein